MTVPGHESGWDKFVDESVRHCLQTGGVVGNLGVDDVNLSRIVVHDLQTLDFDAELWASQGRSDNCLQALLQQTGSFFSLIIV